MQKRTRERQEHNARNLMDDLGIPKERMTALEFLVAAYSNDVEKLGIEEPVPIKYRVEAAVSAANYLHMKLPIHKIIEKTVSWGDTMAEAEQRVEQRKQALLNGR